MYQVDISKGSMNSAVSSQWFRRSPDETFPSLDSLHSYTEQRARESTSTVTDTRALEIVGDVDPENPTRGTIQIDHKESGAVTSPTNHAFNQVARLAGAPAGYLADLPAPLAADCINWGLKYERERDQIQVLDTGDSTRAFTGPDYGRIWHHEIVGAIQNMNRRTGNRFKIPGVIDWGSRNANGTYNYDPEAEGDSTLFCSDRDMFGFLCDDRNPIEVGKLADGSPDLMHRGFYWWNSEEGTRTAGVAAFYLRATCQNRCLWGVENFQEMTIRHTKNAPVRFAAEMQPALNSFANGSTSTFLEGVELARSVQIGKEEEAKLDFLKNRGGLSKSLARAANARHLEEEGRPVENVWDAVQAITAIARDIPNNDNRLKVERGAGALLDKIAA